MLFESGTTKSRKKRSFQSFCELVTLPLMLMKYQGPQNNRVRLNVAIALQGMLLICQTSQGIDMDVKIVLL